MKPQMFERNKYRGFVLALAIGAALLSRQNLNAADAKELIAKYTEDIETEQKLLMKNLGSERSLAISYSHRAKVYLFELNDAKKAIGDFSSAIESNRRAQKKAGEDREKRLGLRGELAEMLTFRAHARRTTGDAKNALTDAAEAIELFRGLVKAGESHNETALVYALKQRIALLETDAEQTEALRKDLDDAIAILQKHASSNEFFQKELNAFKSQRDGLKPIPNKMN